MPPTRSAAGGALCIAMLLAACASPGPRQAPQACLPDATSGCAMKVQPVAQPPHTPVGQGYVATLIGVIRAQTLYAGAIPEEGNPAVRYRVELNPDGEVTEVILKESSGHPAFDEAVRRGILRASPLPRRADGVPERRLAIRFFMKSR